MGLAPRPRIVDWSILGAVAIALITGVSSLVAGDPGDAWVYVLHGVAGLVLVVLLAWKLRRVRRRLTDPSLWSVSTAVSVLAVIAAAAVLTTGILWVVGASYVLLGWNAMMVHVLSGIALVVVVAVHLASRWRLPRRADFEGRRTVLQYAVLAGSGFLAWRLQQALLALLEAPGATRRFTGSRERGREPGNAFPVTSWVADDPDPIDPGEWELRVGGAVDSELTLTADDLGAVDDRRAVLDCTGGWYAERDWAGVRVGRLLDRASPSENARWVRFESVTGYRWSLPIEEARGALLATHVGGERLAHGHGFPARLVAPGRRGFQWVKWVESIEVLTAPDYGQWIAIFTSGFDAPIDPGTA